MLGYQHLRVFILIEIIKVVPREYIARPYANKGEFFVYILF